MSSENSNASAVSVPCDPRTEKTCVRCGRTKSLASDPATADFYVKWTRLVDGKKCWYWSHECKDCWNRRVRANREARRARLGEEAYRQAQKAIRDRSRRSTAMAAEES